MPFARAFIFPVLAIVTAAAGEPPDTRAHPDEIRAFIYAVTIASMASDVCPDILINVPMIDGMRGYFHIVEADRAKIAAEGQRVGQELFDKMAHAENRQVWCDAAYRNYGPDGTVLPKLMKREPDGRP